MNENAEVDQLLPLLFLSSLHDKGKWIHLKEMNVEILHGILQNCLRVFLCVQQIRESLFWCSTDGVILNLILKGYI